MRRTIPGQRATPSSPSSIVSFLDHLVEVRRIGASLAILPGLLRVPEFQYLHRSDPVPAIPAGRFRDLHRREQQRLPLRPALPTRRTLRQRYSCSAPITAIRVGGAPCALRTILRLIAHASYRTPGGMGTCRTRGQTIGRAAMRPGSRPRFRCQWCERAGSSVSTRALLTVQATALDLAAAAPPANCR